MQNITVDLAEVTSRGRNLMGLIRMLYRENIALAGKTESLAANLCRASLRLVELQAEELYRDFPAASVERHSELICKAERVVILAKEAIEVHQAQIEKKSGQLVEAHTQLANLLIQRRNLQNREGAIQ